MEQRHNKELLFFYTSY
uniref:Uncharacterized protein n=1 Tax=Anguilla anguilla TaxID=7936 RepID=A0A0E9XZY1_ANGAN